MTRAKKKSTPKKKPAAKKGSGNGFAQWVRSDAGKRTLRVSAVGALTITGLSLAGWGMARADRLTDTALASHQIELTIEWPGAEDADGRGSWIPESERRRLKRLALETLHAHDTTLDGSPLAAASLALFRTGWLEAPPRVERVSAGLVEVRGTWHVPAAVVRERGREFLISWKGTRLPLDYPIGESGVRFLDDPRSPPPSTESQPPYLWRGDDVLAGLALLEMLAREPDLDAQVAGIDLNAGGVLEIVTDKGTRVVWGSAPGTFAPGEQPDEEKMRRLRALREHHGRIDGSRERLVIYGAEVVITPPAP